VRHCVEIDSNKDKCKVVKDCNRNRNPCTTYPLEQHNDENICEKRKYKKIYTKKIYSDEFEDNQIDHENNKDCCSDETKCKCCDDCHSKCDGTCCNNCKFNEQVSAEYYSNEQINQDRNEFDHSKNKCKNKL